MQESIDGVQIKSVMRKKRYRETRKDGSRNGEEEKTESSKDIYSKISRYGKKYKENTWMKRRYTYERWNERRRKDHREKG